MSLLWANLTSIHWYTQTLGYNIHMNTIILHETTCNVYNIYIMYYNWRFLENSNRAIHLPYYIQNFTADVGYSIILKFFTYSTFLPTSMAMYIIICPPPSGQPLCKQTLIVTSAAGRLFYSVCIVCYYLYLCCIRYLRNRRFTTNRN